MATQAAPSLGWLDALLGVQMSLGTDSVSPGVRSGSDGGSIFNFLRKLYADFHSGQTGLHSHQPWMSAFSSQLPFNF